MYDLNLSNITGIVESCATSERMDIVDIDKLLAFQQLIEL